jgi:cytosine/adenosine deaminase-related metal-dependent hydrolase
MFSEGQGGMFDWLLRSGRDMSDCGLGSPVQHMERHGALGKNLLAVHLNYLAKNDAALLARRKVSVVHCPRSHYYFGHARFPYRDLNRAGVNLCLGTDSLASVYKRRRETIELDMFQEMRAFAAANPSVRASTILRMATLNGARALGLEEQVGEFAPKTFADLIAIPYTGKRGKVYDAILAHEGPVSVSMIDGRWAIPPLD